MSDLDKANRPVREAVARWAQLRGLGYSQHWSEKAQMWTLEVGSLQVRVAVDGEAYVEGHARLAHTDKGITTLLNKIERDAMSRAGAR